MAALTYQGKYELMSGWMWFDPFNTPMRDEGWKLHISGNQHTAQRTLDLVAPVLADGNVAHKFLPDTDTIASLNGLQRGKWLAVYPQSIAQAFMVVSEVDRALSGVFGRHDVPCILKEKWVGRTVVYTRYGAYSGSMKHPTRENYVDDSIGDFKPSWIADPWGLYSSSPDWKALSKFEPWPTHDQKGWRRRGR